METVLLLQAVQISAIIICLWTVVVHDLVVGHNIE